jgi:hypothetical protein
MERLWIVAAMHNALGGAVENHNALVRIIYVLAKICTKHLPNTSLEHYSYANLFGASAIVNEVNDIKVQ